MSEGKSEKSVSVFNLTQQANGSQQGTFFQDGEPLSAEMLTNESRYLIDMIGSHQLLPTMESGLIGMLEWNEGEPKWSTIEINSDKGPRALPAGTVFRLKNGFAGRLEEKIEGGAKDQQYLVLEENRGRSEDSKSRFHATLTDEKPNADCNGAYCRVTFKVANSDAGEFDTVYLRSTSVSKTAADDFERRLSEIVQMIQKYLKETSAISPHVSALLLHDLMSFSKLQTLVDTEWVEAKHFQSQFFTIACASKVSWKCLNNSISSILNGRKLPVEISKPTQASLLKWLDDYSTFFTSVFEDLTWQSTPEQQHEGYTINQQEIVLQDYQLSDDQALHRAFTNYRQPAFRKWLPAKQNNSRVYLKADQNPQPILVFPTNMVANDPLGPTNVSHVGNEWYYFDIPATIDAQQPFAVVANQQISQMHFAQ